MKSLADGLPPEIAREVHPDWRENEAAYWAVRDQILGQYQGQWISFADGAVIASGTRPAEVFHAAQQSVRHPFVICVGREEEPIRIPRATYLYDVGSPWGAVDCRARGSRASDQGEKHFGRIRLHGVVHRYQRQAVLKCLSHQDAIEGIAVQRRELGEMRQGPFLDGKAHETVCFPLQGQIFLPGGAGKDSFPGRT